MKRNIVITMFLFFGLIANSFVNAAVDTRDDANDGGDGGLISNLVVQ